MKLQINYAEMESTPAIEQRITDKVDHALRHTGEHVTRVEVHVRDDNRGKGGPNDKRVTMEARIAGRQPLVVEDTGSDLYRVIDSSAEKLRRAVKNELERLAAKS